MLETLDLALSDPAQSRIETFAFISGQCFPLRPIDEFESFLDHSPAVHCRAFPLLSDGSSVMGMARLTRKHYLDGATGHFKKRAGPLGSFARRATVGAMHSSRATVPQGLTHSCGSQWTALPRQLCEEVVDHYRRGGFEYLRQAYAPDEVAIPTFVHSSPWSGETQLGGLDPVSGRSVGLYPNFHWLKGDLDGYVDASDIMEAKGSGKFFIRKVEPKSLAFLQGFDEIG